MKFLYKFILAFLLIISSDFFPQIESPDIINRTDGIDVKIIFNREPYSVKKEEDKDILEYSNAMDEGKPGAPALPSKTIFVAIPPNSKINPVLTDKKETIISNVDIRLNPLVKQNEESLVYKKSEPDSKYFIDDVYPSKEIEVIGYTWIRDYYCAAIQINTHRYNWKKKEVREISSAEIRINFSDVKPFTKNNNESKSDFDKTLSKIILNYESAVQYRSFQTFHSDTTGDWIDYSKDYVKLAVSEDGIYKISYSDLQSYGLDPLSVNPLTFKIFFEGKQIPIFVSGENDFSFDQNDYIEFRGEKNYGSSNYREIVPMGDDYLNYFDRYNDTNFVWLTWGGDNGLRPDSIHSFIPGLTDSIKYHIVKLHLEKDVRLWYYDAVLPRVQLPDWQENKVWTWQFLGNGGSISFNFDSPDFVPNSIVKTTVRLISNAADINIDAHSNGASINSSVPADTIIYNFRQTVNLSSQFSSGILNQTGNVYRVFGLPSLAGFHQSLIDWIDIDYFRLNKAIDDSLMITIPDSVTTSTRIIVGENISDINNISVYKIKPQLKRITSLDFSSGTLTFTDTVSGGDKYLIIKDGHKKSPRFVEKKQFVNLRDDTRIADYIIITNKDLEQSANQYKNFIENNYQIKVEIVYIDDIYDEFSFGLDNAEAVRDFLSSANQYWQAPKPSYLNIIGDANYDYKHIVVPPTNVKKDLVPAYGNPVSDVWYVSWDSSGISLPQMFVGRIPAMNNEDVLYYLQKHQTYINRGFDTWNKNYLFFSGGDITKQSELSQIKAANDNLLNNLVKPEPVGGSGIHFYKTVNPPTNFGPYSLSEVQNEIDNGGLFISYIGHSGTQTWDNGIHQTEDLKNNYNDRNPLITDFGCSTGKFAEPDIDAFGELFLLDNPNGQAINYLGNTSWGYLSTSLRFPYLFYKKLLIDTVSSVGEAHMLAKMELFEEGGYIDVNRVFYYCNFLFGDPIISFKTPLKTNFSIKENSFSLVDDNPSDMTDSVVVKIEILNTGKVFGDSLTISIVARWANEITYQSELKIPVPLLKDTLTISIPIGERVGQHRVEVELDDANSFDEIYETDNAASFTFTVFSTSVRPVEVEKFYNTLRDSVRILNPVSMPSIISNQLRLSLSDNSEFINALDLTKNIDSVYTTIGINGIIPGKRYWWRVKLNDGSPEWSDIYSFRNINKNFTWFIDESFNENDLEYSSSKFDSLKKSWVLTKNENLLEVSSAGTDDGEFGSMLYNGQERLPSTYYWGIATAEIDSVTLEPSNFRYFIYGNNNSAELMKAYLDSLPINKIVAMTICADGAQSVLGFLGGTEIRRTIEGFGSLYVDSVRIRDSWCMIGRKGAPRGSVQESFVRQFLGFAETSTSNIVNNNSGVVVFPAAQKSYKWLNIEKQDSLPPGSSIEYFPLGIKTNGEVDTLNSLSFTHNVSSLSQVDASVYSSIKILAKLNANEVYESPSISSVGINYDLPPELATNYQVVQIDSDTLLIGENVKLDFSVYNASETKADSFNILVETLKSNSVREVVSNISVDGLAGLSKKFFEVEINSQNYLGNNNLVITIDPENKIPEIFEDNNFAQVPFYVEPDTTIPSINITIDGSDILDGDYVSANPEIKIELIDQSLLPVNDTSSVSLFLNDEQIYFANNPELSYLFSSANPKMVVTYKPHLASGEYTLRVFGKNASGNAADSAGVEKNFIVNEETEILNVFNYPNPSKGETYFTFKLTQIPDELKIKIYTVAGRLIKEIKKTFSELQFDFNTIYWDGRDDDKNYIANGVYFYKIIISKDGKNRDVTQKLAIVR